MANKETLPTRRTVQSLLEQNKKALQTALPRHMTADRMIRVVVTAMTTQPLLEKCTVPSLIRSVIECAQVGLEPDGVLGYAYLVPFRNKAGQYEAKMILGYRGYIALARRSGQLEALDVDVICQNEKFEYRRGTDAYMHHARDLLADRGERIGAYACARLKDGGRQFEILGLEEIHAAEAFSRAGEKGPWKTHWDAMAKKTAIRALCKYLALSPELQHLAVRDEYLQAGVDVGDLIDKEDAGELMAAATASSTQALRDKYLGEQSKDQEEEKLPEFPGDDEKIATDGK